MVEDPDGVRAESGPGDGNKGVTSGVKAAEFDGEGDEAKYEGEAEIVEAAAAAVVEVTGSGRQALKWVMMMLVSIKASNFEAI